MKFKHLIYLFILLTLTLSSCKNEQEAKASENNHKAEIVRLSSTTFFVGDTITIYGKNFGAQSGDNFVEFTGSSVDEPQYISWSDTAIKVVVPKNSSNGTISIKNRFSNSYEYKIERHFLINVLDNMVNLSLFITIIFIYLQINKIWKRKYDREVAESQSLAGLTIYILNCFLWISYYIFVEPDYKSMIDTAIYIFQGSIFFLIGTGFWVKGQKRYGFWILIKQALKLERKEANYLLKRFFKPQNADIIINILHQIAMIDNEMDEKEREMIELFAKEWNIDYSMEKFNKDRSNEAENNYIRLRDSLVDYLDREPPIEQVAQLKDMVNALINADNKVTKEEELIASELMGIIDNYLDKGAKVNIYSVIIVPQQPDHENVIKGLIPDSVKVQTAGGVAYSIGSFYSSQYADMICRQFRKQHLFTIVHSIEEDTNKSMNPGNRK